jgi:hypothetical protein
LKPMRIFKNAKVSSGPSDTNNKIWFFSQFVGIRSQGFMESSVFH